MGKNGSKKIWFLVCNLKQRRMIKDLHFNSWFYIHIWLNPPKEDGLA
jgi:hypothetical protein